MQGADQHGIHILAGEQFVIVDQFGGVRIGQLFARFAVDIPHIANGGHFNAGNLGQRFHQLAAASAGSDAADLQGVVGQIAFGGFGLIGDRDSRRGGSGLQELPACEHGANSLGEAVSEAVLERPDCGLLRRSKQQADGAGAASTILG